ncbi:tetratricopeptide repeat protein [uncultured Kriegella sp.]|uniref:tetratricopeptide repeat protein n=1 Tax=uncultured Kriegella sp. TaxID=1798910 RepID=UPI0030DAF184|tara:strand:- start:98053 stop:99948 length:1896 start_codon:yes stop_codon:yes gene_type:complete
MKLKTLLLLLIFILCSHIGFAQYGSDQKKIDSLLSVFKSAKKDTNSVYILIDLWRSTINSDVDSAIKYAKEMIELSNTLKYDTGISTGHQRLGIAYSYLSDYSASNREYLRALKIYEKHNSQRMMGSMLFNIGINHQGQGLYDSAFHYNKLAENKFIEIHDTLRLGSVYDQVSGIYLEKGQYLLSLKNAIEASKIFKKHNDSARYGDALIKIADNYESMGNFDDAENYYRQCITLFESTNDMYYKSIAYRKLGILFRNLKPMQRDSAEHYINQAAQIAVAIKAPSSEGIALNDYGHIFLKIGDNQTAKTYFLRALELSRSIGTKMGESSNLIDLGKVDYELNNFDTALQNTLLGIQIAKDAEILDNVNRGYESLSKIYKSSNNLEKALYYQEEFKQLNDSIYNIEKATKLNELQTIYETEKKEASLALQEEEINTLNEKAKVDKLTKSLYAGGMFSFLAVSGLLFFGFRQRIKRNKVAREKQEEIYKQQIEHKKKELASQTLHLVQKNTFIQELQENLENLKNSPEKFKIEFRRIVMLLKKQNAEDKDWEVFKTYFAEVHNDFDQKLKTVYADITEKEIRLAAFLRMNLSTKEIAAMFNVMPDSILKSKYRLKKKLALDKKTDLNSFLNTL